MAFYPRRSGARTGKMEVVTDGMSRIQIDKFFAELASQFEPSIVDAAIKTGLSLKQLEYQRSIDKDFDGRINSWETNTLDRIEEMAMRLALKGDGAMCRFVLQAKRPEKFGRGANGDTSRFTSPEDLKSLTDEELDQLCQQYEI